METKTALKVIVSKLHIGAKNYMIKLNTILKTSTFEGNVATEYCAIKIQPFRKIFIKRDSRREHDGA